MTPILNIPKLAIEATLSSLKEAGQGKKERVLLWLAPVNSVEQTVQEVYLPIQESDSDYFWVCRKSMVELFSHLRQHSLMITAQIHSHPYEAFHSAADNKWAIIRHIGALSFVVPDFASNTSYQTFLKDVAVFSLSKSNRWIEIPARKYCEHFRIKP